MDCANVKTQNNRLCRTIHLFNRTPGGTVGGPGTFASLPHHNLNKTQLTMVSVSLGSGPSLLLHTFFYSCFSRCTGKSQNCFHCVLVQLQSLPRAISPEDRHGSISLPQPLAYVSNMAFSLKSGPPHPSSHPLQHLISSVALSETVLLLVVICVFHYKSTQSMKT